MDEERIVIGNPQSALSKEQKAGLAFVIGCGLCSIVLGGLYLWRHAAAPFVIEYSGPKFLVGDEKESAAITKEKASDTDKDTISDYDEKNIYATSPYIADTDSDGLRDDVEITTGSDPNCATGKTCNTTSDASGSFASSDSFYSGLDAPEAPETPTELSGTEADTDTSADVDAAAELAELRSLPTAQIRELLISSGADAEKVNSLTETEVRDLFEELLSSIEVKDTSSTTTNQ